MPDFHVVLDRFGVGGHEEFDLGVIERSGCSICGE